MIKHLNRGLLILVVTGFVPIFATRLAPQSEDSLSRQQIAASVQADLAHSLESALSPINQSDPSFEQTLADKFQQSAANINRLLESHLIETIDTPVNYAQLKLLARMLTALARLHESRAIVLNGQTQTHAIILQARDPANADPLFDYWQTHRPWLDAELTSLRYFKEGATGIDPNENPNQNPDALNHFIAALERDLDRLTQAALNVEVRRVDVWIGWANRRPADEKKSIRKIAENQAARLGSLTKIAAKIARARHVAVDPRLALVSRDLKRIARN